jgi:hypothetical protein
MKTSSMCEGGYVRPIIDYVGQAGLFDELYSRPGSFHPVSGAEFPAMGIFHRSGPGLIADGPFGLIGSTLPVALITRDAVTPHGGWQWLADGPPPSWQYRSLLRWVVPK